MEKPKRPWTVGKHSELKQIDDNLWAIEDVLPPGILRRMCIIRRGDGSLLFFHAVPVDDATLAEIRALGTPKYLVVGHHQHAVDTHAFQEKLGLKTYGPAKLKSQLEKRFSLSGALEDIPSDTSMECIETPGSKHHEVTVIVKSGLPGQGGGSRVSILTSDALQNNPPEKLNFFFKLLGFGGGPKVVPLFRLLFTSDKAALKQALIEWAAMPGLKRLVPFHGDIVENPAEAIRKAASTL
jgi:hypothetical protein